MLAALRVCVRLLAHSQKYFPVLFAAFQASVVDCAGSAGQQLRGQFAGSPMWHLPDWNDQAPGAGSARKRRLFLGDVVLLARSVLAFLFHELQSCGVEAASLVVSG